RLGPPTRATTGLGHSQIASSSPASRTTGRAPSPSPSNAPASIAAVSLRSAPEQKTGPVCESTITRTASSATAAASASPSWLTRAEDRALRLCGLSRVSVATPRPTSTRTRAGTLDDMPSRLPDGEAAPTDGTLPVSALAELRATDRGFGVYVHIPFCASRCGYCDFNTYTA